ncbi:PREDICTED: glucan endo-1,3-beta-glucosidase 5-like [Camelina sativa]|uniref:glucan endo-1,3-beta-D-glucosidase n=1 Tax=Camelina sativa TaxID=90675 RepID=A0ABM0TXK5_CAMSA|nr:PREDICTED: glucan endo-1,3-beta-glucosidase 5-like [Camelina sativa]
MLSKGVFAVFFVITLLYGSLLIEVEGIGVNWGSQARHPLPPATVVRLLRENGIQKVKLFEADSAILKALSRTGIQVMVGIPNDLLAPIAGSVAAAERWVSQNVSAHVSSNGVDIRYVAVGNEPFLKAFNGTFESITLPALQNIQSAIIKAGLATQVKVTVPLNADVYQSASNLPSDGDFRPEIRDLMLNIVKFLSDNQAPFTINIYPFISLYNDPNFPVEFAFFDGTGAPINDNGRIYDNVLDANYDTLVWSLQKNGFGNLTIIVGEVGWPTDGDKNANMLYARRYNQGFMNRQKANKGTPMRPGAMDAYLFSLIDEDAKSIQPGNFERHWGIFYIDGHPKYQLSLGTGNGLIPAKDVHYLAKKWCILAPTANLQDPQLGPSVSYACDHADCTSLGYGSSCGSLNLAQNVSYAFNSYYQVSNQLDSACKFPGLSIITNRDPSVGSCKFKIMIKSDDSSEASTIMPLTRPRAVLLLFLMCLYIVL